MHLVMHACDLVCLCVRMQSVCVCVGVGNGFPLGSVKTTVTHSRIVTTWAWRLEPRLSELLQNRLAPRTSQERGSELCRCCNRFV